MVNFFFFVWHFWVKTSRPPLCVNKIFFQNFRYGNFVYKHPPLYGLFVLLRHGNFIFFLKIFFYIWDPFFKQRHFYLYIHHDKYKVRLNRDFLAQLGRFLVHTEGFSTWVSFQRTKTFAGVVQPWRTNRSPGPPPPAFDQQLLASLIKAYQGNNVWHFSLFFCLYLFPFWLIILFPSSQRYVPN